MNSEMVRIWDLPTRLFHWALLAAVVGLFATAYGPATWIEWHPRLGYAVLALLLFRLLWGLVGGHWSRFTSFLPTPRGLWAYLRGRHDPQQLAGHTPLGALAVLAILGILLAQVATGLVIDDEIAFTGPLNRFVSTASGLAATAWHKGWGQWLIVALVGLHIVAIAFYRVMRRNNLVAGMLHGDKPVPGAVVASRDDWPMRLLALVVFASCVLAVWWLVQPAPLA